MDHHYDDPIGNYGPDGSTHYVSQEDCFSGQTGSYVNHAFGDLDLDDFDVEFGLSSPSPMRVLEHSQNRIYPNHRVHTVQSGMSQQHGSEIQQRVFRGFQNSRSSPNYGAETGPQRTQEPSQKYYHGNHPVRTEESNFTDDKPKRNGQVKLRPVLDLPDKYRSLFKFGVFNAVQSTCFNEVYNGNKNLVISAPTGSGKTVLFELAMIRTLERGLQFSKPAKCIYIAPTKALCTEKFHDWTTKFEPLGFKCSQMTGDTVVFGIGAWGDAKDSSIIVTTSEKWDSLTRNWNDYDHVLSQVELFLVDEVHILNEPRGSTLEAVTSRMKLRRPTVRFILVSATVPNIRDVAEWIGSGVGRQEPAMVFEFGDDYRPCRLTRHIVGVPRKNGVNDFQFAKSLDSKLFPTLLQYSVGKPILVFCATRKGVFGTAEHLVKEYRDNETKKMKLPWSRPARLNHSFSDKRLDEFASVGIGVHHAGLTLDDRRAIEQLYLDKVLRILIATSTLAVGVNLPAHMVVIKGVHTYQNNATKEYSDLDVMQMLGRAGRPQFDKDGIAVIMCETQLESKYRSLVQGRTILESSLHLNLAEHLNAEIGLGTITNISLAKEWLHNSFLFQRIKRNPKHYAITTADGHTTTVGDELVLRSIEQLEQTQLLQTVDDSLISGGICSTQFGEIMSKYYIRRATMEQILKLSEHATLRETLETICAAEESITITSLSKGLIFGRFCDCKLRVSEKTLYNKLRRDIDIRFEVKKVEKTCDKIFILVQAILGGISLNSPEYKATESQPYLEAFAIFKHIARIARAALDVAVVKKHGAQIKNGLELFRCLTARAWEDRAIVLRQIENLGEKSIKVLAEHGITSLALLRKQDPLRIEALLNRRPPFGLEVLASVLDLPQYTLVVQEIEVISGGGNPVEVHLRIDCTLVEADNAAVKPKRSLNRNFDRTSVLTLTSDMGFIDYRRIPNKALLGGKSFELDFELKKPSQSVTIIITSEYVAGVACQQTYKPNIPPTEYPVLNTRPMEMDLIGLENDPDFWNMTLESDSPKRTLQGVAEDVQSGKLEDWKKQKPVNHEPARCDDLLECNHFCNDQTSCRHLRCHNGLPPPISKGPLQPSYTPYHPASRAKQPTKLQRIQTTTKESVLVREKKSLKQLEVTHERASAVNDFKLPDGQQRLKIESRPTAARKLCPPVDYDIHFTDIKDPKGLASSGDFPDNLSDEDLPASILPVDGRSRSNKRMCDNQNVEQSDSSHPPRKYPRQSLWTSASGSSRTLKTNEEDSPPKDMSLLFLPDSSGDEGSIEISSPVPSRMTTKRGKRFCKSWLKKQTLLLDISEAVDEPNDLTVLNKNLKEVPTAIPEPTDHVMDEIAELEAWLESGAFEVV